MTNWLVLFTGGLNHIENDKDKMSNPELRKTRFDLLFREYEVINLHNKKKEISHIRFDGRLSFLTSEMIDHLKTQSSIKSDVRNFLFFIM
jgi:hypothetical protein